MPKAIQSSSSSRKSASAPISSCPCAVSSSGISRRSRSPAKSRAGSTSPKETSRISAVVDDLGALWSEAEKLAGRPLDPLDPDLIATLG